MAEASTPQPVVREPAAGDQAPGWRRWAGLGGVYLFVVVLLLLGRVLSADFWTGAFLLQVVRDVAILGIAAVGVGMVTISGNYVDLTLPGIMAVAGIVCVALLPQGLALAILAGVASGALLGLLNGYVVGCLRLNPIVWTLAGMALIDGVCRWAYGGKWVYVPQDMDSGRAFAAIYRGNVLGALPIAVLLFAGAALAAHVLLHHTVYGKQLLLTGSSYETARCTGVNVRRTVLLAFVFSAVMSSIAGIVKTSLNTYGDIEIGLTYDFQAITAVVLGGVSLAGGRGGAAGILGGVLTIGLLGRILPLIPGLGQDEQLAIRGAVFVCVVALSAYAMRRAGRSDD